MQRHLTAAAVALGLATLPAVAAAGVASSPAPVKLTDAQLDEVTAGVGPPAHVLAKGRGPPFMRNQQGQPTTQVNFVINDVQLTFNVGDNSSLNFAAVLQLALLAQPVQSGSATAVQTGG